MVFEDVTVLELHLHTGEEDPFPAASRSERDEERPTETERSTRRVSPKTMAIAMLVVSIALSLVVTLLVRRFRSNDGDRSNGF